MTAVAVGKQVAQGATLFDCLLVEKPNKPEAQPAAYPEGRDESHKPGWVRG